MCILAAAQQQIWSWELCAMHIACKFLIDCTCVQTYSTLPTSLQG